MKMNRDLDALNAVLVQQLDDTLVGTILIPFPAKIEVRHRELFFLWQLPPESKCAQEEFFIRPKVQSTDKDFGMKELVKPRIFSLLRRLQAEESLVV